jgi:hypothetical protein
VSLPSRVYALVQRVTTAFSKYRLHRIEQRRINILVREYTARGYKCVTNQRFFSGVDILVFNSQWLLCVVIESANYSSSSRLNPKTFKRYMDNFKFYRGVDRILSISFKCNLTQQQYNDFVNEGVAVQIVGYQD